MSSLCPTSASTAATAAATTTTTTTTTTWTAIAADQRRPGAFVMPCCSSSRVQTMLTGFKVFCTHVRFALRQKAEQWMRGRLCSCTTGLVLYPRACPKGGLLIHRTFGDMIFRLMHKAHLHHSRVTDTIKTRAEPKLMANRNKA